MPNVNLIREQQTAIRQAERRTQGFFYLFLLTVAASLAATGFLFLQADRTDSRAAELKRELVELQPLLSRMERNQQDLASLTPKLTTLTGAQSAVQRWSRILDHLASSAPDGLWLTSVRCRRASPTEPIVLTTTGQAFTQEAVGELITRLQLSRDLENVRLRFTQADASQGEAKIKFEVLADVVGSVEEKPGGGKSRAGEVGR
jgi:Tfp pilus assembly protein PilN